MILQTSDNVKFRDGVTRVAESDYENINGVIHLSKKPKTRYLRVRFAEGVIIYVGKMCNILLRREDVLDCKEA